MAWKISGFDDKGSGEPKNHWPRSVSESGHTVNQSVRYSDKGQFVDTSFVPQRDWKSWRRVAKIASGPHPDKGEVYGRMG